MTLYFSEAVTGATAIPYPAFAGHVVAQRFTATIPEGVKAGDIIEIGALSNGCRIVDAVLDAQALGIIFDLGLMDGQAGKNDASRLCGDELFSGLDVTTDGGLVRLEKADALRIAPSDTSRGLGVKVTSGTTAKGTLTLTLFVIA